MTHLTTLWHSFPLLGEIWVKYFFLCVYCLTKLHLTLSAHEKYLVQKMDECPNFSWFIPIWVTGGSSLSREAQTSLSLETSSSSSGSRSQGFSNQPRDTVPLACPGFFSGASSWWDTPGGIWNRCHLSWAPVIVALLGALKEKHPATLENKLIWPLVSRLLSFFSRNVSTSKSRASDPMRNTKQRWNPPNWTHSSPWW